jgi:Ni/Co efflux regulator RcnB
MKPHHWYAAAFFVVVFLVTTGALAQEHTQFDDHARQVTKDYYNQHQGHPPKGFRNQDRLSAEEEAQLEIGKPVPSHLRRKFYTAPSDLRRQLPPPPSHHRYVTVGHHVALVDDTNHVLRDIIHLH